MRLLLLLLLFFLALELGVEDEGAVDRRGRNRRCFRLRSCILLLLVDGSLRRHIGVYILQGVDDGQVLVASDQMPGRLLPFSHDLLPVAGVDAAG